MIFMPAMIEAILEGRKTQTTRPVRYAKGGGEYPCHYRVGHEYRVQPGRGKHGLATIRATRVTRYSWIGQAMWLYGDALVPEPEHPEQFARAEGFESADAFLGVWRRLYAIAVRNGPVWVIDFELVEG